MLMRLHKHSLHKHVLHKLCLGQYCIRLIAIFLTTFSMSAIAQSESDIKQWLKWLGVTSATEQADRVIAQEVSQYADRQAISRELLESLRETLLANVGSQVLTKSVLTYVIKQFPSSSGALAQTMLNPLFIRARNFDVAMEMEGAFEKLQSFDNSRVQNASSKKRIALLKQLDEVQRTSQIASLIQTELNIIASKVAANLSGEPWQRTEPQWLSLQRRQRQRHMQDVIVRLNFFSYRFMKDSELEQYIQVLQSSGIQLMLDLAERGIQQSLTTARANVVK